MEQVKINGKTLRYQSQGEGYPVLLGHSYLWDSNMWAPQLKSLSKQFRCIAPDMWGHGQSDPLDQTSYTIEQLAEDYYQFIQALGIEQCAIVGLSVGGMWGTHLALRHPEVVSHLVLMDTFVGPEPKESQAVYFDLLDKIRALGTITPELAEYIFPFFFSPKTMKSQPELIQNFVADLQKMPSDKIPCVTMLGRTIFTRTDVLDKLGDIKAKMLIMVGEDDMPRPPSESQLMAERANCPCIIVPDGGHIANLENPPFVDNALLDFLSS